MPHGPRFEALVAEAKRHIEEIAPRDALAAQADGAILIDVREADEFAKEHAQGALHFSKGMIELKIEQSAPDCSQTIICYCGGGNRSALAAESLRKMGYDRALSLTGGFKAWRESGLPTES